MRPFCSLGLKSVWGCTVLGRGTTSSGTGRLALRRAALDNHAFTSHSKRKLLEWPLLLKSSVLFL